MSLPDLGCACAGLRRAARLVTQLYGRELGSGLEPTQYALLNALGARPGLAQAAMVRALGLDKTSLSRNLRLMSRNGWIEPAETEDQRERGFRLTASGSNLLSYAKPRWRRAQAKLRSALGSREWEEMRKAVDLTAEAALRALEESD